MKPRVLLTDELLRIVMDERARLSDRELVATERELTRRLGGSRQQARHRDHVQGAFQLVLGMLALILAAVVFLAGLGVVNLGSDTGLFPSAEWAVAVAAAFAVGGVIVFSGVALLAGWKPAGRIGWAVRKLSERGARINRRGPWPEDLLAIVGPERPSHSAAETNEAMEQIRGLYDEQLRATRRTMRVSAGIGAYGGLLGTVMLILTLVSWLSGEFVPGFAYPESPGLASPMEQLMRIGVLDAFHGGAMLTFPILLVGCLALLFRREWGRKILVGLFALWTTIAAAATILALGALPFVGGHRLALLGLAAWASVAVMVYAGLIGAVQSAAVREICARRDDEWDLHRADTLPAGT